MPQISDADTYAAALNAGFSEDEAVIATAISFGECPSRDPTCTGDKDNPRAGCASYGLWQLNICPNRDEGFLSSVGASQGTDLYDPNLNAKAAYARYRSQGWGAWTVYNNGLSVGALARAKAAQKQVLSGGTATTPVQPANPAGGQTGGGTATVPTSPATPGTFDTNFYRSCIAQAEAQYQTCITNNPDPVSIAGCDTIRGKQYQDCNTMAQGKQLQGAPTANLCAQCGVSNISACFGCAGQEIAKLLSIAGINILLGLVVIFGLYVLIHGEKGAPVLPKVFGGNQK